MLRRGGVRQELLWPLLVLLIAATRMMLLLPDCKVFVDSSDGGPRGLLGGHVAGDDDDGGVDVAAEMSRRLEVIQRVCQKYQKQKTHTMYTTEDGRQEYRKN